MTFIYHQYVTTLKFSESLKVIEQQTKSSAFKTIVNLPNSHALAPECVLCCTQIKRRVLQAQHVLHIKSVHHIYAQKW